MWSCYRSVVSNYSISLIFISFLSLSWSLRSISRWYSSLNLSAYLFACSSLRSLACSSCSLMSRCFICIFIAVWSFSSLSLFSSYSFSSLIESRTALVFYSISCLMRSLANCCACLASCAFYLSMNYCSCYFAFSKLSWFLKFAKLDLKSEYLDSC